MQTLGTHGRLQWLSSGPERFGPYIIMYNEPGGPSAKFGTKASARTGSQAQLEAYYTSRAAWDVLLKMADVNVEVTIDQAKRAAVAGMRDWKKSNQEFSRDSLLICALRWLPKQKTQRGITPSGTNNLTWREAVSGRLDSFGRNGSYHIQRSASGFDLRWLYRGTGSFLGTFSTPAKAKVAAEVHNRDTQSQTGERMRRR